MTQTKTFKYGKNTFKTYFKPVGKGFEIGCTYGNRNYFTSNFINKSEATKWWAYFNKEITSFSKRYYISNKMPFLWYCNFMSTHLNKCYYGWLDKVFTKNQTTYTKAYNKTHKQFLKYKDIPSYHSPYFRKIG